VGDRLRASQSIDFAIVTIRRPDFGGNVADIASVDEADRNGFKRALTGSPTLDGLGIAGEILYEGVRPEKGLF
jgi:hypothetical protein